MQVIQESIIEKAKDFISKHKGKLAAAAGLTALAGVGYYAYNHFNNTAENNNHDKNGFESRDINTDEDF